MLRDLQRAFVQGALSDSASAFLCAQIIEDGIAPERRLAIYRNNAVEGFLKTLQATFPTIVRLSGEDWFRQVGRSYMRRSPSRSGNIHYVGQQFATFLEAELAGSHYEYFVDVARLEWAYQEVLVAADHPSFDLSALALVPPTDYGVSDVQHASGHAPGALEIPGARNLAGQPGRCSARRADRARPGIQQRAGHSPRGPRRTA